MSMSISGSQMFGGTSGVRGRPGPPPGPPPAGGGKSPVDAVTDVLGLSKDEITSALKSGKSLDDLATSQGVSHDDLISALKAGMPDDAAQRTDADQAVEALAATPGLHRPSGIDGPGGGGGTGGSSTTGGFGSAARVSGLRGGVSGVLGGSLTPEQQQTLTEVSSLLGSDPASLMDSLRQGTSLADLVHDKGLDSSALANVIQDGLLVDTRS